MPSFSKPLLASAVLALFASTGAVKLQTLQWSTCGANKCGDLYFACLPGGLFAYGSSAAGPFAPGAGPIVRVNPGGRYNLTIHNTCSGTVDPSKGMSYNSTNLHTHGLHTSGEGNNDNVLRQLDPGNCMMQNYYIPVDHTPGTNWYHPHLHMLTLPQAGGGAFGQWIVDGLPASVKPYDAKVAKFLTNTAIERNLYVTSTGLGNGERTGAVLDLTQNQWHYLRILHVIPTGSGTQPAEFLSEAKKICTVYELATDGVWFSKVPFQTAGKPVYNFTVHAAARLDLAVRCTTVKKFAAYRFAGNTVAYFNVVSGKIGDEMPFTSGTVQWEPLRPNYLADLRDGKYPSAVKVVNKTFPIVLGDDMTINEMSWDPNTPTESFPYGPAFIQQFNVIGSKEHPYHIHQQHFQVVQKGGCGPAHREGEFYDSISDTRDKDCLVRLRFVDFTGKIIHHCHDLEHEDAGMMGYFDIPFAAPGSFEASSLYAKVTPQYQCSSTLRDASETSSISGGATVDAACPAAPIYPWVIMGVSIGIAVTSVVASLALLRRNQSARMVVFEEMHSGPSFTADQPRVAYSPMAVPSRVESP